MREYQKMDNAYSMVKKDLHRRFAKIVVMQEKCNTTAGCSTCEKANAELDLIQSATKALEYFRP